MRYIDFHCDTISLLADHPEAGDLLKNTLEIDLEKLEKGGCMLQDFALFVDKGETPDVWARYEFLLAEYKKQLALCQDKLHPILSAADIDAAKAEGKIGSMLSIEGGEVLGGSLEKLHRVYEDGVRLITLTWNYPNEIAWPNKMEGEDKGLTERGWEIVEEMGRLHMIVDTSHLNDTGTRELLTHAKRAPVASHSDARALTEHSRNLPDDLLKLYGERGGLIGINFSNHFLGSPWVENYEYDLRDPYAKHFAEAANGRTQVSRIEDMVCHGMYMLDKAGEDTIAIGTDFDGIEPALELIDASGMPLLADAFLKAGATEAQVEKIFHKNAERYLKEML